MYQGLTTVFYQFVPPSFTCAMLRAQSFGHHCTCEITMLDVGHLYPSPQALALNLHSSTPIVSSRPLIFIIRLSFTFVKRNPGNARKRRDFHPAPVEADYRRTISTQGHFGETQYYVLLILSKIIGWRDSFILINNLPHNALKQFFHLVIFFYSCSFFKQFQSWFSNCSK